MATSTSVGEGSSASSERSIYDSNGWFGILSDLTKVFAPSSQDKKRTPQQRERGEEPRDSWKAKIAIIDTGILPKYHPNVIFKDFVDPSNDKSDGTHERDVDAKGGHGTRIVALLQKMLPDVLNDIHLYVARTFERRRYDDKPDDILVTRIVDAIEWVKSQNVDIIIMAWGFTYEEPRIRDAINGISRNTLVYVAAGNDSGHEPVQFPARMELDDICSPVIPIFSTTSYNKNATRINPPRMNNRPNFAILGENIDIVLTIKVPVTDKDTKKEETKKEEPEEEVEKPISHTLNGTSYSTAIAAGLAAYLIHFSRQPICRRQPGRELNLCHKETMGAVFAEMALRYVDQGYLCISPGHLLRICKDKCYKKGDSWDQLLREQRKAKMRDMLIAIVEDPRTVLDKDFYFTCSIC
ncbi:peptidase S8/S53 domain-containing protein [Podospora fimiseda]|uniref:Peptidase S8/S53 domain-containing protein n=1 Tax=Podospora fimiseda TaxID=252190 RepID=A0AAN7GXJ4_9PEZI|nr:peptidase S8/S53 domain-containing protein [Podospora fimiseda]